jgi:hypothetical protein
MIKEDEMDGAYSTHGNMRNGCNILTEKSEGKGQFGRG